MKMPGHWFTLIFFTSHVYFFQSYQNFDKGEMKSTSNLQIVMEKHLIKWVAATRSDKEVVSAVLTPPVWVTLRVRGISVLTVKYYRFSIDHGRIRQE